ncbi:hypothetical protein ECANGB1_1056 [Enterospora canceri]|uniref:Tetratricopeptide repeat protein n=1 Tax=Enterospora canceri TaxID=1081671 RepID=A0A1Y1S6V1_9MICR|nr:hypothetical protein ECANGB1_1056 [Enterospora canceri]
MSEAECTGISTFVQNIEKKKYDPREVFAYSTAHSGNFDDCWLVLDTFLKTVPESNELLRDEILAYQIALYINNKRDPTDLLANIKNGHLPKILVVKGFYCYNKGIYEQAYKLFQEAKYRKGMEMCYVYTNKKKVIEGKNELFKVFVDPARWGGLTIDEIRNSDSLKYIAGDNNILYRMKLSSKYDDAKNVNVLLNNIKVDLDYVEKLKDTRDKLKYTAEVDYLIGMIYHKMGTIDKAIEYYEDSIKCDASYMPAVYNLCRIKHRIAAETLGYVEVEDFNAITKYHDGAKDIDLSKCSDRIRRILSMNMSKKTMMSDLERNSDELKLNEAIVLNNLGVFNNNPNKIREAIEIEKNESRRRHFTYNLGLLTGDSSKMRESGLPEGEINAEYAEFKKTGKEMTDSIYRSYLNETEIEFDGDQETEEFQNGINGYFIYKKLVKSIDQNSEIAATPEQFRLLNNLYDLAAKTSSFYVLNMLAVVYVKLGYFDKADLIFRQLENDLKTGKFDQFKDALFTNMGNMHVMNGDYNRAAQYYTKKSAIDESELDEIADKITDIKIVEKVIGKSSGFDKLSKQVKVTKTRMLLEQDVEKAEEYAKKEDIQSLVQNDINRQKEKEKTKQLQIRQLREQRKRFKGE